MCVSLCLCGSFSVRVSVSVWRYDSEYRQLQVCLLPVVINGHVGEAPTRAPGARTHRPLGAEGQHERERHGERDMERETWRGRDKEIHPWA